MLSVETTRSMKKNNNLECLTIKKMRTYLDLILLLRLRDSPREAVLSTYFAGCKTMSLKTPQNEGRVISREGNTS